MKERRKEVNDARTEWKSKRMIEEKKRRERKSKVREEGIKDKEDN